MNNSKLSIIAFVFFLIVPLVVAFAFHPLWKYSGPSGSSPGMTVALISMVLIFLTPKYLLVVIYHFAVKNQWSIGTGVLGGLVALYGSIYIQFWNWGTTTGRLQNPDWGTLLLCRLEAIVTTIIFAVGIIILLVFKARQT